MRKVLNDQKEIDVPHYLEQWARWPTVLRGSSGGGCTTIGRLVSGKRMRTCTLCNGEKKINGKLVGLPYPVVRCPRCDGEGCEAATLKTDSRPRVVPCDACRVYDERTKRFRSTGEMRDGRTCIKCKGARQRVVEVHLVHPATIPSTMMYGVNTDPDPVSALLDRTIAGWAQSNLTYWLHAVVMMEYRCEYLGRVVGGGLTQADKAEAMHVSRPWYTRNLSEAHNRVETLLQEFFHPTIDGDVIKSV